MKTLRKGRCPTSACRLFAVLPAFQDWHNHSRGRLRSFGCCLSTTTCPVRCRHCRDRNHYNRHANFVMRKVRSAWPKCYFGLLLDSDREPIPQIPTRHGSTFIQKTPVRRKQCVEFFLQIGNDKLGIGKNVARHLVDEYDHFRFTAVITKNVDDGRR